MAPSVAHQAGGEGSDLLVRGPLLTLDPARPRAEACIIRGGRFAAVGSLAECRAQLAPGPHGELELSGGACAVPGLADAHGHLEMLARVRDEVDCSGAQGEAECAARAAATAARLRPGGWVRGWNWDETRWTQPRLPGLELLSRAVPDHPVLLSRVDLHAVWLNRRALAACGISRETRDPDGGRLERDAAGEPTGVLIDAAVELALSRIPREPPEEIEAAILRAAWMAARAGLTSVHDACLDERGFEALVSLAQRGLLPLRVHAMWSGKLPRARLIALARRVRVEALPELLTAGSVKIFADGALGSRGARLLDPYDDAPGQRGLWVTEPAEIRELLRFCVDQRLQPCTHAIGDEACKIVLEELIEARAAPLRPRVEHLQLLRPQDAPLLRASGAVASMQPAHAVSDGAWAEQRLGHDTPRQRGAYAWRQAKEAGAVLAFGSDFPVEAPDPLAGLRAAILRIPRGAAQAWMPEQRLTPAEALLGFTWGAAYALGAEGRRGRIAAGFDADLTLLSAEPVELSGSLAVLGTCVAGRVFALSP